MSILRRNDNPAQGRRVLIEQESLKVGYRGNGTYYNGTLNVDVREENPIREVIWIVDTYGSYGYHQDTDADISGIDYNGGWLSGYNIGRIGSLKGVDLTGVKLMRVHPRLPVTKLYRNFIRMFSVRKECDKIFNDPSRYLMIVDNLLLALTTDLTQTDWGVPKVWMGYWGETKADLYVVMLASSAQGTASFNLEIRASSSGQVKDVVSLRVYDTKSKEWIVRGLFTCNKDYVKIEFVNGIVPAIDFDFSTYKGRKVQALESGNFAAKRVGLGYFNLYLDALPV